MGFAIDPGLQLDLILEGMQFNSDVLVPPVLASGGVSVISGTTGVGKSLLALDIALHLVTAATHWHGEEIWDPHERTVLYVDAENNRRVMYPRVAAWAASRGLLDELRDGGLLRANLLPSLQPAAKLGGEFSATAAVGQVVAALAADGRAALDLVVLDTLQALTGVDDGNDNTKVQLMMADAERIYRDYEVPVLLIAHPPKTGSVEIDAKMRAGKVPSAMSVVSGAQRVMNAAQVVTAVCATADAASGERLLCQVKSRSAEGSGKVRAWQIVGVDLALPPVERDVRGETRRYPADTARRPAVLDAPFEVVEEVRSKFGEMMEWLVEQEFTSRERAATTKGIYRAGQPEPPVGEKTLRKYLTDEKHAGDRELLGLRSEQVKRNGRPSWVFWVETGTEG